MKKLIILLLFSVLAYSQPEHEGEIIIDLINQGSSWTVTFKAEAVSARWNQNFFLTDQYEEASETIDNPKDFVYFNLIGTSNTNLPTVAISLYKISAIESNQVKAFFYYDMRTDEIYSVSPDAYFDYDYGQKKFKIDSQIIDGTYQTIWDLIPGMDFETSDFEDYWDNCLAIIKSETGSHPRLVWGPYPGTINGDYIENRIYKSALHDPGDPPSNFSEIDAVDNEVSQYIDDTETIGSDYNAKSYYVAAYYQDWQEGVHEIETNIVEVRLAPPSKIAAENPNSNYGYQLCQNYPNPFNPATRITYTLSKDEFVTLGIYNSIGEKVATLVNEPQISGEYSINFNAFCLTSGIYFYKIQTSSFTAVKKMSFLK